MKLITTAKEIKAMKRTGKNSAPARRQFLSTRSFLPVGCNFCLVVGLTLSAFGEGFRNPPAGAFDLGRAGGRIAQVDDSSAVANNPANLVDLNGTDIQFTPSIVYIRADYKSTTGETAHTINPWKLLPNFFAGKTFYNGKLGVGLGITTPYGIGNEWDQNSSAFAAPGGSWRYTAPYYAQLATINFNPSLAVKVTDQLRFGAGLDVMWSELTLKQNYPWAAVTSNPSDPDGAIRAQADGVGVGANFGLTWQFTKKQRLALTCRTPVNVDYSGHFNANNVPAALGGGAMRDEFKTSIKFPTIVAAGYGIELTDKIRLETDVEWLQFSNFKSLPLKSAAAQSLGIPAGIAQNWRDTFTVGLSGDWKFAPAWVLRAGYQFYQTPVPDSTFSPTIPDADQNVFTLGLGFHHKRYSVEAAYGLDFYNDRNIRNNQNPAFNGKYNFTVHLFSFSYRYSF